MPANLSPEFKQAEEKYRAAKAPYEKLACLEEMLSTIPKHKGTEKMQADIKSKIAKLRRTLSQKKGPKRVDWFHVEKQGAGQVALFGAPNAGKSALVRELTGLHTQVAAYPFTTTKPIAGMMPFEDIQIQLVDTPPIAPETPAWVYHILRTADSLLWILDLSNDDLLDETDETRKFLNQTHIFTVPNEEMHYKKTITVGAKCDAPEAFDRLAIVKEMLGDIKILPVSIKTGQGLEQLKQNVFQILNIIRVYTKKPGKTPDMQDPVILLRGSTVMDAAYHLHKDIAQALSYARLWNKSGFDGQRVEQNHTVQDKDIVEFHT